MIRYRIKSVIPLSYFTLLFSSRLWKTFWWVQGSVFHYWSQALPFNGVKPWNGISKIDCDVSSKNLYWQSLLIECHKPKEKQMSKIYATFISVKWSLLLCWCLLDVSGVQRHMSSWRDWDATSVNMLEMKNLCVKTVAKSSSPASNWNAICGCHMIRTVHTDAQFFNNSSNRGIEYCRKKVIYI